MIQTLGGLSMLGDVLQFLDFGIKVLDLLGRDHTSQRKADLTILLDGYNNHLNHLNEEKGAADSELANFQREALTLGLDLIQLMESKRVPLWKRPVHFIRLASSQKQFQIKMNRFLELQGMIEMTISKRSSQVRAAEVQKIQESLEFKDIDAYGRAAVTALLEQYTTSENTKDATRYLTSAGQYINRIQSSSSTGDVHDSSLLANKTRAAEDERIVSADGTLLVLLQYRVMENRKALIEKAFESYCQWIFSEPVNMNWKSLPDWLARGSDVYLILGNEASGKSTMMKYIYTHVKTQAYLGEWAHRDQLVTVAFFFWRNGTRLEKSEEGLWRSLLYSALDQRPQLIPVVFPRQWAMLYSSAFGEDTQSNLGLGAWDVGELQRAFHRLITQDQMPLKLFILIDGIDEYQHDGNSDNYTEIIQFIKEAVAGSVNAKILISSRPLEAFNQSGLQPSLTLHELNHSDIEVYVRAVLDEDASFQEGRTIDNEKAESIIYNILSESKGVFLWAVLSVRTVKSKLAEGETIYDIALSLQDQLAPALSDLYQVIWAGMDDSTKTQASQILQIMLAGKEIKRSWLDSDEETLRLIDLALGLGDPDVTIRARILPWHLARFDVQKKCNDIAMGFTETWPGFITTDNLRDGERKWDPSSRIRYCHRSVPEFFSEHYTSLLRIATSELSFQFCPRVAHLKSAVHQLKVLPRPLLNEPLQVLWAFTSTALLAANHIDTGGQFDPGSSGDSGSSYILDMRKYHGLLAQLDKTMQHHHNILHQDVHGNYLPTAFRDHRGTVAFHDGGRDSRLKAAMHWSNFHSDLEYAHPRSWNDSFLSLSVQFGLQNYVNSQLGEGSSSKVLKSKKGRPLLDYALRPSLPPTVAPYSLVTPAVIKTLLAHGAHPNDKFEGRTCWEGALQWQYDVFAEGEGRAISGTGGTTEDARRVSDARVEMFRMLLDAGADVRMSIVTAKGDIVSARRALEVSLKGWVQAEIVQELLGRFPKEKTNRAM